MTLRQVLRQVLQEMVKKLYNEEISDRGLEIYEKCCDRYVKEHGKEPETAHGVLVRIAVEERNKTSYEKIEEIAYKLVVANSAGLLRRSKDLIVEAEAD